MDTNSTTPASTRWTARQAYTAAAVCLLLGLLVGYLLRGSAVAGKVAPKPSSARPQPMDMTHVTRNDVKRMADKKAESLLAELNKDPNNYGSLVQLAKLYYSAHLGDDAAKYMELALKAKPDDTETRVHLGIVYFYLKRPDDALREFHKVLEYDPKNADALFNTGMILWQEKNDAKGAVSAWRKLLVAVPDHPKRAEVEDLIARAQQHAAKGLSALP
jgi:cytochrome c-type biogenesis protein CcmH/NrfG